MEITWATSLRGWTDKGNINFQPTTQWYSSQSTTSHWRRRKLDVNLGPVGKGKKKQSKWFRRPRVGKHSALPMYYQRLSRQKQQSWKTFWWTYSQRCGEKKISWKNKMKGCKNKYPRKEFWESALTEGGYRELCCYCPSRFSSDTFWRGSRQL